MGRGWPSFWALCAIAHAGCGESSAVRIELSRLAPPAQPDCGAAADVRSVTIRALGEFPADEATAQTISVDTDSAFRIDRFPAELEALQVEVLGLGGVVRAVGRSGEIDLEGDEPIAAPVFLSTPDGGCATGPSAQARSHPRVVSIAGGALVIGGRDDSGQPVAEVERYERDSGRFVSLGQPLFGNTAAGLEGASVTVLEDGRVVIVGGGATAFQVYDPSDDTFSPARFLPEARGRHAAVEVGGGRVLLAGGCSQVTEDGCEVGSGLLTTSILEPGDGAVSAGPRLEAMRLGGVAVRVARDRVLLAGGFDVDGNASTSAELLDLEAGTSSRLDGALGAVAAQLPSGAVVAVLGGDPSEPARAISPRGRVRVLRPSPLAGEGGTATILENGEILVVAGGGAVMRAIDGFWREVDTGGVRRDHGAARLEDGSVLLVGGVDSDGQPRADAYLYRPAIFGRLSSDVALTFGAPELAAAAVFSDPGQATLGSDDGGAFVRVSGDEQRLIIAGPELVRGELEVGMAAAGGVAVLWGFQPGGEHFRAELVPGELARVLAVDAQKTAELEDCTGAAVGSEDLAPTGDAPSHELTAAIDPSRLRIELDGEAVIDCVPPRVWPRGSVGLAVLGGDEEGLRLDVVALRR